MKTRFEIILDHSAPIDPEKIGLMVSNALKPIMEFHNKRHTAQVSKSTVTIIEHNVPERTAIELPPNFSA